MSGTQARRDAETLLSAPVDPLPRSLYRACAQCGAQLARQDVAAHERWHAALAELLVGGRGTG